MAMAKRDKGYFRDASARSRAKKARKLAMLDSPMMRDAIAICVLAESRNCSMEEACRLLAQHRARSPQPQGRMKK
jgi:hypothetical protein